MKKLLVLIVFVAAAGLGVRHLLSPKAPELSIRGDEVMLSTSDLDVRFEKGKALDETYMVFGGGHLDDRNAVANVTLAGLSLRHAKPIYRRYPDFHRCASPGAAAAKDRVVQLDVVPANRETLATLRSSLEEFDDNLGSGGDRVCVQLQGSRLELTTAEVREAGESVADAFRNSHFYLVESASRVTCQDALSGS